MLTISIQAGGQSRRMGQDKGTILLSGKMMISYVVSKVSDLGDEIIITSNSPENYSHLNLRVVPDKAPGAGALNGLETALLAAKGDYVLVLACDTPFLNINLLKFIISQKFLADIVVPYWDDRFQPMHAVYYREKCLPAVQTAITAGERRMISFYNNLDVLAVPTEEIKKIDPEGHSFYNINTPDDLKKAKAMLKFT